MECMHEIHGLFETALPACMKEDHGVRTKGCGTMSTRWAASIGMHCGQPQVRENAVMPPTRTHRGLAREPGAAPLRAADPSVLSLGALHWPCRSHAGRSVCRSDHLASRNQAYQALRPDAGGHEARPLQRNGTERNAWQPGDERQRATVRLQPRMAQNLDARSLAWRAAACGEPLGVSRAPRSARAFPGRVAAQAGKGSPQFPCNNRHLPFGLLHASAAGFANRYRQLHPPALARFACPKPSKHASPQLPPCSRTPAQRTRQPRLACCRGLGNGRPELQPAIPFRHGSVDEFRAAQVARCPGPMPRQAPTTAALPTHLQPPGSAGVLR